MVVVGEQDRFSFFKKKIKYFCEVVTIKIRLGGRQIDH